MLFRGSLSCAIPYGARKKTYSLLGLFNVSSKFFQIFILLLFLVLDDGEFPNSLLPMELFLSTSTHLALGWESRVFVSTIGLDVISGMFPHY
jgi:hypothetical protein